MISFPLKLTALPAPVREPAAWFIPGDDAGRWLEEIARWEIAMTGLRLFILPTSLSDRTPLGVLIEPPAGVVPVKILRGLPYGKACGRLFIPVDAALDPPIAEKELNEALRFATSIMHPAAGLVGFTDEDVLGVHDLIAPPVQRATVWDRADPGEATSARLLAVSAEEVPGMQEILEQGRDDIGSKSADPMPAQPGEAKTGQAGDLVRRASLAAVSLAIVAPLKMLQFLGGLLPMPSAQPPPAQSEKAGGSSKPMPPAKPGWIESLQNWIARKFEKVSNSMQEARERELERLRKMLETNPDEGLRFAISLRDIAARGRAAPGSQLVPRDTNFNLSSLSGGSAAGDAWSIREEMVWNLTARYREAANRELTLGRFRRAAYIFAELLGDFSSAASALEQGRFYREAAVIYRDHLKQQRQAAACLYKGGLLAEAAAMYEELAYWEFAGDLYAQLGFPDQAERCYREQEKLFRKGSNFLEASRVLELKLKAPDEAVDLLSSAWHIFGSSERCLRELFQLLSRLGRHEDAGARIARFKAVQSSQSVASSLAAVLSEIATTYPQATIRTNSADAVRVVAGLHLANAEGADRTKLVRALTPLAPDDRLLARDVERFLSRPAVKPPARRVARGGADPVAIRTFPLLDGVTWKKVAVEGSGFYALGVTDETVRILRGLWDGLWQTEERYPTQRHLREIAWKLHPIPGSSKVAVIPPVYLFGNVSLIRTAAFSTEATVVCHGWIAKESLRALTFSATGSAWAMFNDSLRVFRSENETLLATHALPVAPPPPDYPVEIVASGNRVYATWGAAILKFCTDEGFQVEPLPLESRRLAVKTESANRCIAVALSEGGRLLTDTSFDASFGEGLVDPLITFTRGGMLVAASATEGRVYDVRGKKCHPRGKFAGVGRGLIAVTATKNLHEFAIFTADGKVVVYQVQG